MDGKVLESYCMSKKGAAKEFPFGDEVAVFKVMGKMFALLPVDGPPNISLKCDPTLAVMLRDTYPAVTAGYHLNKNHWNSVRVDDSIPEDELLEMIDHSYDRVVKGLTKAQRQSLERL
jgi:predicted DNA-binding protein (MmcQ/YjbR family)